MKSAALTVLAFAGLVWAAGAAAQGIHRWVDRDGNVRFTDRPPESHEMAPPGRTSPAPGSAVLSPAGATAVDTLLEAVKFRRQLDSLAARMTDRFQPAPGGVGAAERAAVARLAQETFRSATIYAATRDRFARDAEPVRVEEVTGWYRSPFGQTVVEIETASAASNDAEEARFYAELQRQPPTRHRLDLARRLDGATGGSDANLALLAAMADAMSRGLDPHLPPEKRLGAAAREQWTDPRSPTRQNLRQSIVLRTLYIYRNLGDPELSQYVEFLESGTGRWFSGMLTGAYVDALRVATEQMVQELIRVVPPERLVSTGFRKPVLPSLRSP